MTDVLDLRIVPASKAADSRVGEELVILNLEDGTYYGLDAVGTRIWELLKQDHAPRAICARLSQEFEVSLDVIEADTRAFLSDLMENALVSEG